MKTFKKIFLLSATLAIVGLTGCAFAPLNNITTARTAGKGHVDLAVGAVGVSSTASPRVALNYGLFEDFDLGLVYEAVANGFTAKWSPLNNQVSGISLGLIASYGTSGGSTYWYAGPVLSAKLGFFEPYLVARYNNCNYNGGTFTVSGVSVNATGSYNYMYYTLGSMFWFTNGFGLALEGNTFGSANNITLTGMSTIYGASLVFKL